LDSRDNRRAIHNSILIQDAAFAPQVGMLSQLMPSSLATTAATHGVTSLAGTQTSHSALLAHLHG
jgi:phosphoenolpyruvate-protein kinase (PTS system EI component)